ncbi:glycosyl transferase [Shewanella mangrovi]|uniref:Glycosyl transferase n=1 Tax=Shewanella mangrovi TaxID=1515746 RepID=A0A094JVR9_9GAMM|nr:glycosyltransferase family A protein [Shewanella mangrovi]KFZ36541.1 glycosyl transferase [Shewanella mangrovi]
MLKLSVLVPVYNLAVFIEPCLHSLLSQQTNFSYEVIAVDDGSSDDSYRRMQALTAVYPHLLVLQNAQNSGLAYTQQHLLKRARGEYLVYVDGDDLALPGKLQTLADYLDTHPDCSLCYHEAEVFDSDTNKILRHYSRDFYNAKYIPQRASYEHLIRYGCFPNASSIAFRRHEHLTDAVDSKCKIILDHPWHILNALYGGGSVDFVAGVFGRYRIHSNSFGSQTKRSAARREQVLEDQLRACDNAKAFGVSEEVITAGKRHYYFATALYFLKLRDDERFQRFINLSTDGDWFFDARHQLAWRQQLTPSIVAGSLLGALPS